MLRNSEFGAKLRVLESLRILSLWWLQNLKKLAECQIVIQIRGADSGTLKKIPIGHLGFLGGQLKWSPCMYSGQPFTSLLCFFSSSSFSLCIYFPSESFPSRVSHCPDTFLLQKNLQAGLMQVRREYVAPKIRFNECW